MVETGGWLPESRMEFYFGLRSCCEVAGLNCYREAGGSLLELCWFGFVTAVIETGMAVLLALGGRRLRFGWLGSPPRAIRG